MSLPLLVAFAVVLPLILFGGIYLFSREAIWMARRPRISGGFSMMLAALYAAFGVWEARDGLGPMSIFIILGAVAGFYSGYETWRRGQPQSLE